MLDSILLGIMGISIATLYWVCYNVIKDNKQYRTEAKRRADKNAADFKLYLDSLRAGYFHK